MLRDNSELLRLNKDPEKIMEQLCAEKRSVTYNNKELSHICKYSKEIETAKDQLQNCIDSPFKNLEITRCQVNEENLILEVKL